jgi:hypothetical protein
MPFLGDYHIYPTQIQSHTLRNIDGSSKYNDKNWIQLYWQALEEQGMSRPRGRKCWCCSEGAVLGSHVTFEHGKCWYIVPACKRHNGQGHEAQCHEDEILVRVEPNMIKQIHANWSAFFG